MTREALIEQQDKPRGNEIRIVIGPPCAEDEIGLVYPHRVEVSMAQQIAWGLRDPGGA